MNQDQQKAIAEHARLHREKLRAAEEFEQWMKWHKDHLPSSEDAAIMLEFRIPAGARSRIIEALFPILSTEIAILRQEAAAMPLLPDSVTMGKMS